MIELVLYCYMTATGHSSCVVVEQTSFSSLVSMSGWTGEGALDLECTSMSTAYQTCISKEQRKSCFPRYGRFKRVLCGGFLSVFGVSLVLMSSGRSKKEVSEVGHQITL